MGLFGRKRSVDAEETDEKGYIMVEERECERHA
jgi:hypothetical protein